MSAPRLLPGDRPRLHGQLLRLQKFYLANPGRFFTLRELVAGIGATSEAGVSARLRELRALGWKVEVRVRVFPVREYQASPPKLARQLELLDA